MIENLLTENYIAMHNAFLCKLHTYLYFTRMLNSRGIKFANISENKVLANDSELKGTF